MANTYDVGDKVRWTCTYTDSDGNAQDPSAVFFSLKPPSGTVTTYEYGLDADLVKSATGIYYVDVSITEAGTWRGRCHATGTGQAAAEGYFRVREQKVS